MPHASVMAVVTFDTMSPPGYSITQIPIPPSDDQVERYKNLRLLALRTNPETFGSTYERESSFTPDQWRARINTPSRATFFVQDSDHGGDWVATISILSPEMLQAAQYFPPESVVNQNLAAFMITGMWVRPDRRRTGLGKLLVDAGLASVRSSTNQTQDKVLLLEVHKNNTNAIKLYTQMGFIEQGDVQGEEENIWMVRRA